MEQTTTITTAAPATPALTAVAGLTVVPTAAPEAGAESDLTAVFGALLEAIRVGAAPAPAADVPVEEEQAETSDVDAAVAAPAPTIAAATLVVPAVLLLPATGQTPAAPVAFPSHTRATRSGEAAIEPVSTDPVVPAGAAALVPAPAVAAAPAAALVPVPAVAAAPVAASVPAPAVAAAPVAASTTSEPVAAIVLPSSPALPDGDVDPALVEAAITAATETAPARPAAATVTSKPAVRAVPTAASVTAEAPETAEPQATAVKPATAEATTTRSVAAAEPAAREGGSPSSTGHGGRLDLQVQGAPPTREAAPDAVVETPVQVIDRERVDRLSEGLAARLKVSHAADGARIRMQLEPRELGEVVVRLEIRNGMAHAHLIAESADAAAALQASLADLRSSLADRGLQLDSVSIRVAGEGASSAREQAAQSQGDRHHRAPLSFGRIDAAGTIAAATDQLDRAREGQAVWILA